VASLESIATQRLEDLAASGLDRLTISFDGLDEGGGILAETGTKLPEYLRKRANAHTARPSIDFCFVARPENLDQLPSVARYAAELGAERLLIRPATRRGEIANSVLCPGFNRNLAAAAVDLMTGFPALRVSFSPEELVSETPPGDLPRNFADELPPGARILTCDQNPWETVRVLANGDVVTCEVRDDSPLGNLATKPLAEIWHGAEYRAFRGQYAANCAVQCRSCPYKIAYRPGPLKALVRAEGDPRLQLPAGWHHSGGETIWSRRRSLAMLPAMGRKTEVVIRGLLPPAGDGRRNALTISSQGKRLGTVVNAGRGPGLLSFERAFTASGGESEAVLALEFETTAAYRPANGDARELGFALQSLEARVGGVRARLRFLPLFAALHLARALGRVARRFPRTRREAGPWQPGISIVIPERASPAMLADCLKSAKAAAERLGEPTEIIVAVNGAPLEEYAELRAEFPGVVWVHRAEALGFAAAVSLGVKRARFGGVYLLNSDMLLHPDALAEAAKWRADRVFAVASQIFFADPARRREETGWTGFRVEGPDVAIFDAVPEDEETVRGALYAGGGASLFRRDLLARRLASDPYAPFYWEDVEWGVRAWWEGYEVLFCPPSKAVHLHRATVSRFYAPAEIDRIFERNGLLFELRHRTTGTLPGAAIRRIRRSPIETQRELARPGVALSVLLARLAKSRAPYADVPLHLCGRKFYLRPPDPRLNRPRLLVVTPHHVMPPEHGGARRIVSLLEHLSRRFEIHLLSDEENLYSAAAVARFRDVVWSVHLAGGRPDPAPGFQDRVSRIRTHAHRGLRRETQRLLALYRPDIVQVEYVELVALAEGIASRTPWFLTLHDVLLSERGDSSEDAFELAQMRAYAGIIACCEEDAALLRRPNVHIVPNGVDWSGRPYVPSRERSSLLFIAPFRYPPNLAAALEFAAGVFPVLRGTMPELCLDILGGPDAGLHAEKHACLRQPGIRVHGHTDDVHPWLEGCAVTINPIRGNRGSAIKLAESVAAGRVCISTREGARGFLNAGIPGLVVVEDILDFVQPIRDLLADEDERVRLEAPPAWLVERLSWRRSAAMQEALYRQALAPSGADRDPLQPDA
jgi:GT2 family glycosyltransferase